MPKWLQGMIAPTLTLWLCAIAIAVVTASKPDGELPRLVDSISRIAFSLVIASWVLADAHKRGRRLCHDFDTFVFFAWPLVVPVYLFQTRGTRALLTLLCFAVIWLGALMAAALVAAWQE